MAKLPTELNRPHTVLPWKLTSDRRRAVTLGGRYSHSPTNTSSYRTHQVPARIVPHALLNTGGVRTGTSAVILLIAFTNGLQNAAESGIGSNSVLTEIHVTGRGNSGSHAPGDPTVPDLTLDSVQKLKHIKGVKAVIPIVSL